PPASRMRPVTVGPFAAQPGRRDRRVDAAAHHHQNVAHAGAPTSRRTARGTISIAASTSAAVVVWPRLNRSDPRARAGSRPIASNTCDGSIAPDVQAEPDAAN